jgi:uncharacterized protein YlxW (UPF0749 family)
MLGDATKKIQKLSTLAEKLYKKVNELQERVEETTKTVNDTSDRVMNLESELTEQRALLEAIADENGIDVEDLETDADDPGDESTPSDADQDGVESTPENSEETA